MTRFSKYISALTLLSALIGLITTYTWLLYDYQPFVLNTDPIQLYPSQILSGGLAILVIDYCKNNEVTGFIEIKLIGNASQVELPSSFGRFPKGCGLSDIAVRIPSDTVPGIYYLDYTLTYRMNPIRVVTVHVKTELFEITDKPNGTLSSSPISPMSTLTHLYDSEKH